MEFREMGVSDKTLQALAKLEYVNPTEVQEKAIPEIISGTNLIVRSHTGTGKTAAFGIGIIERITAGKSKKALILCPTRELAVQVCKEIREIGEFQHVKTHVIYGGASINNQMDDLERGVDILIATPGRLLDLSQRGAVRIHDFDICILDEADQMLDMGFIDDMSTILNQLPHERMMLLISATIDESILSIARKYITHPKTIEIGEIEKASTITEEHIEATDLEKFPKLVDVLRSHQGMKVLVFRETKMAASRLQEKLWQRGFKAGVLQGDMTQAKRNKVLHDFKEGHLDILVATNVAGRGLHIENLGLVVNYDQAQTEEMHLHRIGRTGRMGHEGKAINFVKRKESLKERMSEAHPDFAWMRQGGLDSYRSDERRGPPRRDFRRDERPRQRSHGDNPYRADSAEGHDRPRGGAHHGGHGGPRHGGSHGGPHGERRHRRPSHHSQ
ncbi:MAG TPA: DEAD/DEAH box helicase [Candidatus Bilamarchaeum sp.]|nr:DEAD/DEAH box helicase [Candidatus Bilamarchaeum sp.]